MEDLNALGYVSANRFNGLSKFQAKVCLKNMAHFHAASMVLLDKEPLLAEELSPCHYAQGVCDAFGKAIILDGTSFAANIVDKWTGMSQIASKMKAQISSNYNTRMQKLVNPQNAAIKVITHGDLWVNNVLFALNPERAIFVDFQNSFLGSPAIDLQYFFHTSLQLDVLMNQYDELVQFYYKCLEETLIACEYYPPIPSFEILVTEMKRCLFYGYYGLVCELPLCCASKLASADLSIHTFSDEEAMLAKRKELFANKRVLQTLKAMLKRFDEEGVLDLT